MEIEVFDYDKYSADDLLGTGVVMVDNFPIEGLSRVQIAAAYLGLSSYLGHWVPQSSAGLRSESRGFGLPMGEVRAEMKGATPTQGRQANNYFRLHTDRCDVISLVGIRTAKAGGHTRICSATKVYNVMLERHPELARSLFQPFPRIWEGSGGLAYHRDNRGAFKLDFTTCDASAQRLKSVNSKAIKVHGALMIAAWAYLSPFAVVAARSKNSKLTPGTVWLKVHAVFQICALVLTAVGLAKAIMAVGRADGVDHLSGRHQKLGVGVGVAAGVNLLMGALRPHAPGPGEDKTALRLAFEVAHRVVGYGAVVLGGVTMLAGVHKAFELDHISQVTTWNTAIIAPLAVSAFLIVALTAYISFVLPGRDASAPKAPVKDIP